MRPLVSIIIPVYNSENYIWETISSCLEQTYTKFEIIVVNDGSKDDSEKIIGRFEDDRIRYFKISNSGPCYARNFGVSRAKGDLFQFLDADDILEREKLASQVKHYRVHGEDNIYSGRMGSIEGDTMKLEKDFEFYYKNLGVQNYFREMFGHFGKYYTTGMWLVPRKLVEKTHGWNEKVLINNDGEYFSRIILHSKGIIFCPEAVFYYRRDVPMSVSKRFDSKGIYESWLYSYSCYVEEFNKSLEAEEAKDLGRKALSVYYCNSYPKYPDLLEECKNQIKALGFRSPIAYGSKKFKVMSSFLGVDNALRIRTLKDKRKSKFQSV